MPDLKSDADSDDQQNSPPTTLHSSTPHRGAKLMNQTFDISQIPNLTGGPQDAAAIAAEVSAAAAAQASKEFHLDVETQRSLSSKEGTRLMLN